MKTLIVITGPTAVGKTALSLQIAERLSTPIISADSRQMYRDLRIGTAAPTEDELRRVRHYFVGTLGLTDYYSASMFEEDVLRLLQTLFSERDYALMAGGSMMYIDAVCQGIDDLPTVDDATRGELKRRLAEEGLPALVEELHRVDPEHWAVVDRQNPRRVVHALEICQMTGRTYTSFRIGEKMQRPFRILKVGLNRDREELYDRINRRCDQMMSDGLLDEARRLMPYRHENALNTVGYKEMFACLDGRWTPEEAVERMKGNTRRYARKQLTWLKRDPEIRWFSPNEVQKITDYLNIDH